MLLILRKTHLYFGLFISPALLFFAFTGAVQTLSLHEAAGTDYKPPALLASLGQLHKKQTPALPAHKQPPPGTPAGAADGGGEGRQHGPAAGISPAGQSNQPGQPITLAAKQKQHWPLKGFFLIVSLGLFTSTLTGVYMAYKYDRSKALVTGLLAAGTVTPILLVRF